MDLKGFREAKGISLEAISKAMEISPNAYKRRESGKTQFKVREVMTALHNLGLSKEDEKQFVELLK